MRKLLFIVVLFFVGSAAAWANSVTLLNNTPYTLKAMIYGADGTLLGEFILNPQDATQWSDNYQNFGPGNQSSSLVPYTVNWYCMAGGSYGSCTNVAAGSTVTAQSCGGAQECPQQQVQPY